MNRQSTEGDGVQNWQNSKTGLELKFLISGSGSGSDGNLKSLMEGYSEGQNACVIDTGGN